MVREMKGRFDGIIVEGVLARWIKLLEHSQSSSSQRAPKRPNARGANTRVCISVFCYRTNEPAAAGESILLYLLSDVFYDVTVTGY